MFEFNVSALMSLFNMDYSDLEWGTPILKLLPCVQLEMMCDASLIIQKQKTIINVYKNSVVINGEKVSPCL